MTAKTRPSVPPKPTSPEIAAKIRKLLAEGREKEAARVAIEADRVFEFISGEFDPKGDQ